MTWTDPRDPRLPRALLVAVALAAFGVRWVVASGLPSAAVQHAPFFQRPWHRPPLMDLVSMPFGAARYACAIVLGVLAVLAVTSLASRALPRRGMLLVAMVAVILPSMVLAGAWWSQSALVVPLVILSATSLSDDLDRDRRGFASTTAFAVWLLLLSDWPAWAPVLAWLGWLVVFPPASVPVSRVRRATLAVAAGVVAAVPIYGAILLGGGDPAVALAAREVPLGPEAILAVLDSVAGTVLGRGGGLPRPVLAVVALLVLAASFVGQRRASEGGRGAWADVLIVGSLGAFVPALAAQPWIPIAADKHVWYMGPLILCLGAAALFGVRREQTGSV